MTQARKVLISSDDRFEAKMLSHIFGGEGFMALEGGVGDVFAIARDERPDVTIQVVQDLDAPCIARLVQLREHRSTKRSVLVVVAGADNEQSRLQAFEAGADEVLPRSCSVPELLHRVRVILRRNGEGDDGNEVRAGDILLNLSSRFVKRGARTVVLAPLEAKLLQFMMNNRDRLITRQELMSNVWGQTALVDARTVDVAVNRLRRNINVSGEIDPIRTVHGQGYAFGVTQAAKRKPSLVSRAADAVCLLFAPLGACAAFELPMAVLNISIVLA